MQDIWLDLSRSRGTFQRHEAIAAGLEDRALYRALGHKELHRVRHGTYAPYAAWQRADDVQRHLWRADAVLHTAGTQVALASATALLLHGCPAWNLPLEDVQLLRLDGRAGRREAGVQQRKGAVLEGDLQEAGSRLLTSPVRSAIDLATTPGIAVEVVVVILDDLMRRSMVTKHELWARAAAADHVPGSLRTDLAIRLSDPQRESVGETRTAFVCWRAGLPRPTAQYELADSRGHVWARLDFAWPELGIWLEFDGKEKYLLDRRPGESEVSAVLRAKRAEQERERRIVAATGWRCIRVTWADLAHPERLIARLQAEFAGARHAG